MKHEKKKHQNFKSLYLQARTTPRVSLEQGPVSLLNALQCSLKSRSFLLGRMDRAGTRSSILLCWSTFLTIVARALMKARQPSKWFKLMLQSVVDYMARYSINNIKVSLYAFSVHCQISTNSPGFYKT